MMKKFLGSGGGGGSFLASRSGSDESEPPAAQWVSRDPRNNRVVAYDDSAQAILESAYSAGLPGAELVLGGNVFVVDFSRMVQVNASGGAREVKRVVTASHKLPLSVPTVDPRVLDDVLQATVMYDARLAKLEADPKGYHADGPTIPALSATEHDMALRVYDVILALFTRPEFLKTYGYDEDEDFDLLLIRPGNHVPPYFANVTSQSIFQRKVLSLLGLRNLLQHGPSLFEDMRAKQFTSHENDYQPKKGPSRMRYLTGNVVDLDSVVLRCNERAIVDAINTSNKKSGLKPFKDGNELAQSAQCKEIVFTTAEELIAQFCKDVGIAPDGKQAKQRRVLLDKSSDIYVATGHQERGLAPVWQYKNLHVNSFHCNVPNIPDVVGALLRAPLHVASAFALLCKKHPGRPIPGTSTPVPTDEALAEFFDDCIADSCFNQKWKAVEEYRRNVVNIGSLSDVLSKIQQENQAIFTPQFIESDPTGEKELAEMIRLAQGHMAVVDGVHRAITTDDVKKWHAANMAL